MTEKAGENKEGVQTQTDSAEANREAAGQNESGEAEGQGARGEASAETSVDLTSAEGLADYGEKLAQTLIDEDQEVGDFFELSWQEKLEQVSDFKGELKVGTVVNFDFHKNLVLELQTSLGDVLPESVRKVSSGGMEYTRRGNRGFFSESGDALMLLSGLQVKIEGEDKQYSAEKEFQERFAKSLERGKTLREIGRDFMIDPYFVEAVTENLSPEQFGFEMTKEQFEYLAARFVQNAEAAFGYSKAVKDGHYNGSFLIFALNRFNLFGTYEAMARDKVKAIVKKYSELSGVEIKINELREKRGIPNDAIESVLIDGKEVKGQPVLLEALVLADADMFRETKGQHLIINEHFRTEERQREIRREFGYTSDSQDSGEGGRKMAAPPGKSFHEKGLAVDVSNWQVAEPFLRRYGLVNGVERDKNHFSMGETNREIFFENGPGGNYS